MKNDLVTVSFMLNGRQFTVTSRSDKRLLDILRDDAGLTGPKEGCGEGECGACSIFRNGLLVNSCMIPAAAVDGDDIVTIEGFSRTDEYRILSEAFSDAGAVQCGFCTPGFMLAAAALLRKNPSPDDEEIKQGLSGNLCRCTGYTMIIEAVKLAAERGKGLW